MIKQRKIIEVSLYRKALVYDAENIAFIIGDNMQGGDEKEKSGVMDVGQDGNIDRVTRVLNKSFNELVYALTAYTKEDTMEDCVVDNLFTEPEVYVLKLSVPVAFSKPNMEAVKTAAHEYLVCMSLFDWFTITKKDEAQGYYDRAQMELVKLKGYLEARTKMTRRRLSTF